MYHIGPNILIETMFFELSNKRRTGFKGYKYVSINKYFISYFSLNKRDRQLVENNKFIKFEEANEISRAEKIMKKIVSTNFTNSN